MTMAAGLSLMQKLGAKVASMSSPSLTLDSIKSGLRSEATSVSIYAIKIDDGDKKGWCVKQPVSGGNPLIVDPNYPTESDKHYKGTFDNLQRLQNKYSPDELVVDDYAFVLSEVVCMQDTVSNVFLKNSGTGNFNLGSVINSSDEYTILDYLESTGTQYIDTNIKFQANDRIEIEVTPTTNETAIICGASEDSSKTCMLGTSNNIFCGNSTTPQSTPTYVTGTKYKLINTNGQWSYNGTNFGTALNNNIDYTCTLFAKNGQQVTNYSKCKIHSYKHIRNGQTILDLRPVNRLADLVRWKWDGTAWKNDNYVLEQAITFTSQSDAQNYINTNHLQYEYPNHIISTVSPTIIEGYVPESSDNVDAMTEQLGPDCLSKNAECWGQTPPRPGTPIEFMQKIKQKIFSFG